MSFFPLSFSFLFSSVCFATNLKNLYRDSQFVITKNKYCKMDAMNDMINAIVSVGSTISSAGSTSSSGSITSKKSVSFPEDNVVSQVHSIERSDDSLKEILYYSAADFRRFKMERRLLLAKAIRMSCNRSRSRVRGTMQYDRHPQQKDDSRSSRHYSNGNGEAKMRGSRRIIEPEILPRMEVY